MEDVTAEDVAAARRYFAQDLRLAGRVGSVELIDAFSRVPRERFIGPGPWRIGARHFGMSMTMGPRLYQTVSGDDPRALYHDLLVALDEEQEINNGQPSLWAVIFDKLAVKPGEQILHVGCGTGYYSAILAELTGGAVTGVEVDDALAARAREALQPWPNARVICASGAQFDAGPMDVIVVSAGLTHPLPAWLDALRPGGRLVFPLTVDGMSAASGAGAMLLVTRTTAAAFAAQFIMPVGFIHFQGGRAADANTRLMESLRSRRAEITAVRSLRREPHPADAECWLHGDGFCLSYLPPAP
jgi:protein-L-isoaspartate(D-aspartate) O-methyltransferase